MDNRYVLQLIVVGAANLSLFDRDGFQVKKTEIKEGKENVGNVVLTPFQKEHGKIIVAYFKKESEIAITCESEVAQEFAENLAKSGELIFTNTFISINRK
ncbi:MAG: hypothetical protein WA063_02315 [Minisyncoccia bacterium]